jgi:hypothetical protein
MRFVIDLWNEREQHYGRAVTGDSRGVEGAQAVATAFEDAGVTTVGCYRVISESIPEERPAYYDFTVSGELLLRETPCS